MLFAILFDGDDQMIAAAPAVFQYATGDVYWHDTYSEKLDIDRDCQTAYVEVKDDDLIDMLNTLEYKPEHMTECRRQIQALTVGKPTMSGTQNRAA